MSLKSILKSYLLFSKPLVALYHSTANIDSHVMSLAASCHPHKNPSANPPTAHKFRKNLAERMSIHSIRALTFVHFNPFLPSARLGAEGPQGGALSDLDVPDRAEINAKVCVIGCKILCQTRPVNEVTVVTPEALN